MHLVLKYDMHIQAYPCFLKSLSNVYTLHSGRQAGIYIFSESTLPEPCFIYNKIILSFGCLDGQGYVWILANTYLTNFLVMTKPFGVCLDSCQYFGFPNSLYGNSSSFCLPMLAKSWARKSLTKILASMW